MKGLAVLVLVSPLFLASSQGYAADGGFAADVVELVTSWAPLVFLHSQEVFYPSEVEFFLPEVTLNDGDNNVVVDPVTPQNMPAGRSDLHLQTRQPLGCPSCLGLAVFHGQPVATGRVPVYAFVREYDDADHTVDVIYHTFYPYNRGKDVCIGIGGDNHTSCTGVWGSFGNHVGDWENNRMRFVNSQPYGVYLSVHSFGAYYLWNGTAQQFDLEHGEPLRWNEGGARADWFPAYPDAVQVMTTLDGARHPIVFSANGSHGLWASSGSHVYFPVLPLVDHCDTGTPWRTWENLILLPWQKH